MTEDIFEIFSHDDKHLLVSFRDVKLQGGTDRRMEFEVRTDAANYNISITSYTAAEFLRWAQEVLEEGPPWGTQ